MIMMMGYRYPNGKSNSFERENIMNILFWSTAFSFSVSFIFLSYLILDNYYIIQTV